MATFAARILSERIVAAPEPVVVSNAGSPAVVELNQVAFLCVPNDLLLAIG